MTAYTGIITRTVISDASSGSYLMQNLSMPQKQAQASIADATPMRMFLRMNGLRMKDHFAPTSFIEYNMKRSE